MVNEVVKDWYAPSSYDTLLSCLPHILDVEQWLFSELIQMDKCWTTLGISGSHAGIPEPLLISLYIYFGSSAVQNCIYIYKICMMFLSYIAVSYEVILVDKICP